MIKKLDEKYPCPECGVEMLNKCQCHSFKLCYDPKKDTVGWSHDGYATTQYWKDYKAAKARGEKVKPAGSD